MLKPGDTIEITKDIWLHGLEIGSHHIILEVMPEDEDSPYLIVEPTDVNDMMGIWIGDDECKIVKI